MTTKVIDVKSIKESMQSPVVFFNREIPSDRANHRKKRFSRNLHDGYNPTKDEFV
jgi:hypothetical protein